MQESSATRRQWTLYLLVPFLVHLVLSVLARTPQFTDGPLENFYVRFGIAAVVTMIVAAVASLWRSAAR
ncbi:hypothetical protein [Actinoplanes xinjiangensis]|uniref:hypothetical protein n=1 Tax=Actinoplanes xinjiangensis TaxID=512350 RepID=UPI0011B7553D|nr:hypothetical protein [Actinoplanes xinjiangensis]GIF40760.1 hypothetical protein Axi01nite_50710 [Actinoplanes xinjiangensis]